MHRFFVHFSYTSTQILLITRKFLVTAKKKNSWKYSFSVPEGGANYRGNMQRSFVNLSQNQSKRCCRSVGLSLSEIMRLHLHLIIPLHYHSPISSLPSSLSLPPLWLIVSAVCPLLFDYLHFPGIFHIFVTPTTIWPDWSTWLLHKLWHEKWKVLIMEDICNCIN